MICSHHLVVAIEKTKCLELVRHVSPLTLSDFFSAVAMVPNGDIDIAVAIVHCAVLSIPTIQQKVLFACSLQKVF
jgi:hypothetical protein